MPNSSRSIQPGLICKLDPRSRIAAFVGIVLALVLTHLLTGIARADGFRVLENDCQAAQARIDLIQQAECEICVAYYAVSTGELPTAMLELLRQAALRGVRVRLLVDGLVSRLPAKFESYLMQSGMQIRVYHAPHQGNAKWLNRRLHTKLLVVDSQHVVIGSRNLRNQHFGLAEQNFSDTDAYVHGDIGCQAASYFDWLWRTPDVMPAPSNDSLGLDVLSYRPSGRTQWNEAWRDADSPQQYQLLLNKSLQHVACRLGVQFETSTDWSADAIQDVPFRLLHDCHTDKSKRKIRAEMIAMIDAANVSLLIESPYPVFTPPICDAIGRATCRGVCVTLLTNSLASTDRVSAYAAYQNDKRTLLRRGLVIYEYCGPCHLHAKSMIVDDRTFMIGSYNFDPRSDKLNLELCIRGEHPTAAAALKQSVLRRMARSDRIRDDTWLLEIGGESSILRQVRMQLKRPVVTTFRSFL